MVSTRNDWGLCLFLAQQHLFWIHPLHGNKYFSRLWIRWKRFSKLKVGICGVLKNIMSLNIEKQQGKFFSRIGLSMDLVFLTIYSYKYMCLNITTLMGRPCCQIITMIIFSMTYTCTHWILKMILQIVVPVKVKHQVSGRTIFPSIIHWKNILTIFIFR